MRRNVPQAPEPGPRKPDLTARLAQVRRMVERTEQEQTRLEAAGLRRLALEKAQEKRYWQFVQAVLELKPWMGQTRAPHTMH